MQASVVLGGEVVATVRVAAAPADLSPLDVRAVEHATVVTALELLRARTAAEVEQRLRGSLMADVLSADGVDTELLDRARRLGWDLSGEQHLVAVRHHHRRAEDRLLADVDRLLSGVTPRPLVAIHRGDLVLMWPAHDDVGARLTDVATRLVDALSADRAVAAVSPAAPVAELPGVFRTLRGALSLAADNASAGVVDLRDVVIDHLLLQLDDPQQLRQFARTVLGPALDYDRNRSTELLHTARMLLDHDLDRAVTAKVLHLHPNTVAQRIRRLEELTGLRIARPRDLLQLTAALTVARIVGMG
jgi:sugar diacid utilization regulator